MTRGLRCCWRRCCNNQQATEQDAPSTSLHKHHSSIKQSLTHSHNTIDEGGIKSLAGMQFGPSFICHGGASLARYQSIHLSNNAAALVLVEATTYLKSSNGSSSSLLLYFHLEDDETYRVCE